MRRPDRDRYVVCFGESDLLASVYGIVNVARSGLKVNGLNRMTRISWRGLVPFGGAPNIPHMEPEHSIVPSE
jgi:hypothetical protein